MNDSGVLEHQKRSPHEPESTPVGGGRRYIAPQHMTPAGTAQGTAQGKRKADTSGVSGSGYVQGDGLYSNSESGKPALTMVRHPLPPSHTARSPPPPPARSPPPPLPAPPCAPRLPAPRPQKNPKSRKEKPGS